MVYSETICFLFHNQTVASDHLAKDREPQMLIWQTSQGALLCPWH